MDSFTVIVFSSFLVVTLAYPQGAKNNASNPMEALSSFCTTGNFRPNHADHMPQATTAPFTIQVYSPRGTVYSPGQAVTVTIQGLGTETLKGFFIQGDATEASFAGDLTCTGFGHQMNFCGRSGITHSDPTPKPTVQCKWTPPDFQIGSVQFTATIVKDFSTFWTGVKSEPTLFPDPTTMTYEQKSKQLKEELMNKFQQQTSGMFQSQLGSGAFAGLFNQFQKQGQTTQRQGQGLQGVMNNLSSWFGGQSQGGSPANNANSNSNGNNNNRQQSNPVSVSGGTGWSQYFG